MLTQDDLKAIGELLTQQKQDILSSVDEKLKAQDARFDEKLAKQRKEIVKDVTDYIHDDLSPVLDEYAGRITRLEEHTQHPPGTPAGVRPTSLPSV